MYAQSDLIYPALITVNVEFEPPSLVSYIPVLSACCFFFVKNNSRLVILYAINQVAYF